MSVNSVSALRSAIEGGRLSAYEPTSNPVLDAVLACSENLGESLTREQVSAAIRVRPASAEQAARALGIPIRPIDLAADGDWWHGATDPMVVRVAGEWCAVLPGARRSELLRADGTTVHLDAQVASEVDARAWALIPRFPDAPITLRNAARIGWTKGSARDVLFLIGTGVIGMGMGVLVPLLSGLIIGEFVPASETSSIVVTMLILMLASVISALLVTTEGILVGRMSGRFGLRLTEAAYERIFRLRTSFHRTNAPGELASRIDGIAAFEGGLASIVPASISAIGALIGSVLVISSLSGTLAVAVVALSILSLAIGGTLLPKLAKRSRELTAAGIELSGTMFALLGGIAKIRTAGAEQRMLDRWTFRYARVQGLVRDMTNHSLKLSIISGFPPAIVPVILVFSEATGASNLSLGEFTTATSAGAQAAAAIAGLLPLAINLVSTWPSVQTITPILEAEPEPRGTAAGDPGELRGDVSLDGVNFSYDADTPVLTDISFTVPAGTMTAIVGASGSGKSTIVRLLLGIEQPESGTVLYDGQSLATLDRLAVLSQMGIVPQDAALVPGSILENILASSVGMDEDAAWWAAEAAGIADDIREMPMGMQTVVSGGLSTFSGGQRQRLMLARALVHRPRIVILDEATSALDNRTQRLVGESIARLGATRIVVAHRLSTVVEADQIIVLDAGRVVETGTYDQLKASNGLFAKLASRQTV